MGLLDILQHYADGAAQSPPAPGPVQDHFDAVSKQASPTDLGGGLAAAFRSDATPPFGQMVSELFNRSNPQQQAGLLNQLVQSLGPAVISSIAGGVLGKLGHGGAGAVTPEQASQVPPTVVADIATHAEKQDASIIDKVGGFYAQHPTLVQTLGAAAMAMAMSHMSRRA